MSGLDFSPMEGQRWEHVQEQREAMRFRAWRQQTRIDGGTLVWLCEKGHIDDQHVEYTTDHTEAARLCSRCGGSTELLSLDQMAYTIRYARNRLAREDAAS